MKPQVHSRVILDLRPLQGGDAGRGIGATIRGLAGCFPELDGLVWAGRPQPEEASGRSLKAVPGPRKESRFSWAVDSAATRVHRGSPRESIWHLTAADVAFGGGGRYVVTVNDTIPWRFPELYPAGPTGRVRMALTARLVRNALKVVVPSLVSANDVRRYLGVPESRIAVIPWAADPGLRLPSADEVHVSAAGLSGPYVLMAGGFAHHDPRKRFEDAVIALEHLPKEVSLLVTGKSGPAAREFTATVASAGMEGRVRLTGHLSISDLSVVLAEAAAFVFPSMWEGFGLPLLDAFTLGVPTVISDGGSLPEVADGAALVYPAGDAVQLGSQLSRLFEDRALASDLAEKGLARSRDFSWEKTADLYRRVYEEAGAEP